VKLNVAGEGKTRPLDERIDPEKWLRADERIEEEPFPQPEELIENNQGRFRSVLL